MFELLEFYTIFAINKTNVRSLLTFYRFVEYCVVNLVSLQKQQIESKSKFRG